MYSYEDSDTQLAYFYYYSLFDLEVNIDGEWKQGFACGSDDATMPSATIGFNEKYPYKYPVCLNNRECGNMLVMPAWYCNECTNCNNYIHKGIQDCKYLLKNGNGIISNVNEIPKGYRLDYPTEHSAYIQVMLMDSPFYYKSDYWGLQVVCLWLMIIIPSFLLILGFIYVVICCIFKPIPSH